MAAATIEHDVVAENEQERESNQTWHIAQLGKIAKAIQESRKENEEGQKYVTRDDLKGLIPGKEKLSEVFKPINGRQVPGGTGFFFRYKDKLSKCACVTIVSEKPYVRAVPVLKHAELLKENILLKQRVEALEKQVEELKNELKPLKELFHKAVTKSYDYGDIAFAGLMQYAAIGVTATGGDDIEVGAGGDDIEGTEQQHV